MSVAPAPDDILRFLAGNGPDSVLVTLVAVIGSASRRVGSQMGVSSDGRSIGSFSGGCIEAAVVAEALDVLASGQGRVVRFGAGSPYLDVRLPCGGGIDLMFTPRPDPLVLRDALAVLAARTSYAVPISPDGIAACDRASDDAFHHTYDPPLRIVAIGQGEDLSAFVRLSRAWGAEVVAVAPAESLAATGPLADAQVIAAPSRYTLPAVETDRWTGIVFLFHDRDWEEFLLPQALALESFYCGAIGSPRTQAVRRRALQAAGVPATHLARLRDTVGLIPATRDPATLALSILAELVADYRAVVARTAPAELVGRRVKSA